MRPLRIILKSRSLYEAGEASHLSHLRKNGCAIVREGVVIHGG